MKKKIIAMLAVLAAVVLLPHAHAALDPSYAVVTDDASDSITTTPAASDTGTTGKEYTVAVSTGAYKLDAAGKAYTKVTVTFAEGTSDVKLDGKTVTIDKTARTYTLVDTLTLADFQKATDNVETDVIHEYVFTFTIGGETRKQTVIFKTAADGSDVTLEKADSTDKVWDSAAVTTYKAGKVEVTVNFATNVSSLTSKVGTDLGTPVKFLVKVNTKLTQDTVYNAIRNLLAEKGYKVVGYYTAATLAGDETDADKVFKFNEDVVTTTTIYAYVDKGTTTALPAEKEEDKGNNKGDSTTNPDTGDSIMSFVGLASIALVGSLGTGLYLKKVNE